MYWVLDFERVEYSFFNLLVPLLVKILIVFTHEEGQKSKHEKHSNFSA